DLLNGHLNELYGAMSNTMGRRKSTRKSSGGGEDRARILMNEALAWIATQKRMIETTIWADDPSAIQQQLINHQRLHASIQGAPEVLRAIDELKRSNDKPNQYTLEQEWDSLKKMSNLRTDQLRELSEIVNNICDEIMWVNDREEQELMFDWGDKNIEEYIPKKQESYSRLMKDLEEKEMELHKIGATTKALLKNNHPASDKIEAYMETLQTQWSWLLQITKCIDTHLKENAAYSQFFKETNATMKALHEEHELIRKSFVCNKNTSLDDLKELLKGLEREKEKLMDHKRQVQHLTAKSKSIVRLKPRNPEEKGCSGILVKALTDYKQDQKAILTGNEAILKDNSQRSKWKVIGPGGLDMLIPSVCLIIPPPNPLCISLAAKNEQYYEAIMSIWHQLYINVKSLIAWQYCLMDIKYINSLTISMLSKMRPEEYRQILRKLEAHYEDFKVSSHESEMIADEDKRNMEDQVNGAHNHYNKLKEVVKVTKTEQKRKVSSSSSSALSSSHLLSELHALRLRMDAAEGLLGQYVHICFGEDGAQDCGLKITQIEDDIDLMRDEYLRIRERILKESENMSDVDKAQFLRSEVGVINQRLGTLESSASAYVLRLRALRDMLESIARAEDIVKVHEARLTEKETTSLSPAEVSEYMETLKNMRAELVQKRDILTSMESELSKANHWNSQMGGSFHRCDLMLSKFSEQVGMLSDRWRRIQHGIINNFGFKDHYKQTSTSIIEWIDATRRKQDALQATKIETVQALNDHINNQKALNMEIKAKRETVESVLKDNEACVNTIKDYETDLNSYTSGLETLLSIPIKRTMLKSPSMELNQEAIHLQTRYMELLTLSGDYYKFLGESLKNMEQLKIRNTRIDLLEEELRRLKDDMQERNDQNKSLEDAVAQFKLQLSRSQEQLLSLEEVKQTTALQCSATKDSLDSTQSQLTDLKNEVERLKYLLGEEKRKTKLAEERYTQQQEEYDSVLRKRQQELETVSWSKVEVEKSLTNKEHEIEKLRQQLAEESARFMEQQKEMSKVRSHFSTEINSLKLSYESQIQISRTDIQRLSAQRDEDTAQLQMQYDRMEAERRNLEDELRRLRTFFSQTEEQKKRAEEEAFNQRAMLIEDGHRRREMESQMELLMKQRDEEKNQHKEELAEVLNTLQEKNDQLVYVTHSLEEETRRRKTAEEGQVVLEQSLGQLQVKLNSSSMAATQLSECQEELLQTRSQLERENKERCRMEQNMSRLQGRIKDLQAVRDSLEGQVENLRKAHQEEVSRRTLVEGELEKTTVTMTEYTSTITTLLQSQEQASTSQKRSEEEHLQLKEELEKTIRENQICSDRNTQLSAELKNLKEQLLQEKSQAKEANLRNEVLYKTIGEKTKALNESSAELQRLKEVIETQTRERLRMEEELRAVRQEKEEVLKSKKGIDDELSSQITALELQLQASERSNAEHRNLVSELSSEREKLKLEAEKIEKQVTEVHGSLITIQSLQSKYNEIVSERDSLLQKLQRLELDKEQMQRQEEELNRLKLSLESEFRNKQRLQEENERVKRDLSYWKDQCDGKQSLIRQYDTDKDILEREKKSLKSEIEKLMKELRELEEKYKSRLQHISYQALKESCKIEPHTGLLLLPINEKLDPSKLIFDGVRKPVTAKQLFDCGVLDKPTYNKLIKGDKTVPEVSLEKKIFLKGTGSIAGVTVGSLGKMSLSQAKTQMLMPPESADVLLEAQAATGHIIDPMSNQKLTVDEACARRVVDRCDRDRLLAAEAAAVGYKDPHTGQPLSVFEAVKKGLIDKKTGVRLLQAQESVGGILDPSLSVFLPKDIARKRGLIDEDLYQALNQSPECYLDPDTQQPTPYISLKKKCKSDPSTGLLLLPKPKQSLTIRGLRNEVSVKDLVNANLLTRSDVDQLNAGKLTSQDIENRLRSYLGGSTCIAGVYDEASDKVMSIYQAMDNNLLRRGTTLELLEAQAASGFMIDPINNLFLTVAEAYNRRLFGPEFKEKLLSAEKAVTGYKMPGTDKIISLFQAIENNLVEKGHGIRLLEAQIASGGIIDPQHSHRIDVNVAYKRGYFNEEMNKILTDESDDTKGFFDPNTEENLTYLELKKRCIIDKKTGLVLLPIIDKNKQESSQKNTVRKRRVIIVDPETGKEMTVREAYQKGYIDRDTYLELSEQECEWEEITITAPDGSIRLVIIDRSTGRQYDINDLLENQIIDQSILEQYRSHSITLTQFADIIRTLSTSIISENSTPASFQSSSSSSSSSADLSDSQRRLSSVSITLSPPLQAVGEVEPVGAIFDTEVLEKISVTEALNRGLVDSITAQRLLEAQACTGGIVNPTNGKRLSIQEASRVGLIANDMVTKLKPAQKAYFGFEDIKINRKLSAAQAMKEMWLPYEAGQRFLEFQVATGGLYDPEKGCRRSIEDALTMGWLDVRAAQKLQDIKLHTKILTCPKSKLRISYKEALDNCLVEDGTGVKMLQASSVSSRGISSPYNVASAPGSKTGSRSGSQRGSRRSSLDLGSSLIPHSFSSFTSFSSTK
uniref:Desmoplakin n=1 Tax=Fundulus heteroclitus TaxID=8078 RepID=A0A3Q2P267_FUNHE